MIPPILLDLLRCPLTMQPLHEADAGLLQQLRATAVESLDGALVREDGSAAYPVREGIPILLPEAAIELTKPS